MSLTHMRSEAAAQEEAPLSTMQRVRLGVHRFTLRLSHWTESVCAHRYAVVVGLLIIIGLLAAATSMVCRRISSTALTVGSRGISPVSSSATRRRP